MRRVWSASKLRATKNLDKTGGVYGGWAVIPHWQTTRPLPDYPQLEYFLTLTVLYFRLKKNLLVYQLVLGIMSISQALKKFERLSKGWVLGILLQDLLTLLWGRIHLQSCCFRTTYKENECLPEKFACFDLGSFKVGWTWY